jgi:hypothetical protein
VLDWLKIVGFALIAILFILSAFFGSSADEDGDSRGNVCIGATRYCD